jgi:hypothetical protein
MVVYIYWENSLEQQPDDSIPLLQKVAMEESGDGSNEENSCAPSWVGRACAFPLRKGAGIPRPPDFLEEAGDVGTHQAGWDKV